MNILGIETSCDETAASIVKDGRKILSNIVATSVEMHTKTGGIIPEKAAREQIRSILRVVQNAMLNAKCQISNIDGWTRPNRISSGWSRNRKNLSPSLGETDYSRQPPGCPHIR